MINGPSKIFVINFFFEVYPKTTPVHDQNLIFTKNPKNDEKFLVLKNFPYVFYYVPGGTRFLDWMLQGKKP